ncbi:MAG: SH3 domain-containing protein, partial [Anaerolineae bacterium]|nr:SH3 domain-containing protein [Anaerolineae bacterium]
SGQAPANAGESSVSIDFTVGYALRLRSAPTTEGDTLARIPYTTIVQAVGRTSDNRWLQVRYAGQVGWVAAAYGRLNGNFNSLPVR